MSAESDYIANMLVANLKKATADLFETNRQLIYAQNILRALRNPDMLIEGGVMTVERIQALEDGNVTILPPRPVMPKPPETKPNDKCVPEPSTNGKKMAVS